MTVFTDNAAAFAWNRDDWLRAETNATLADFDRALRDARHADDPRAAVGQACADVAGRLGGLGADVEGVA